MRYVQKNYVEAAKRLMEEQLFSAVAYELKNNVIREGLMAKALVETSDGLIKNVFN